MNAYMAVVLISMRSHGHKYDQSGDWMTDQHGYPTITFLMGKNP